MYGNAQDGAKLFALDDKGQPSFKLGEIWQAGDAFELYVWHTVEVQGKRRKSVTGLTFTEAVELFGIAHELVSRVHNIAEAPDLDYLPF